MAVQVKEFETMVQDTLRRIVNSTKITNTVPGSVVRTIVESLLAELDIQYYELDQIFKAMDIDTATGSDLDSLVKILGVVRKSATKCIATITFGRSEALQTNVDIPIGSVVSTYTDTEGNNVEFVVSQEGAVLEAGQTSVDVECTAKNAGEIYVPKDAVIVMNTPIVNIEYVNNKENIFGGTDVESDDELRERSKGILDLLGKGTVNALEAAILAIDGVQDAVCSDLSRGVGTADMIVVTDNIPPAEELKTLISDTVELTKAAGIDVGIIYPNPIEVNVNVTVTGFDGDKSVIGNAILSYGMSLGLGVKFIINQLERYILNACGDENCDITTTEPAQNVDITSQQIARVGTITINGELWTND